MCRTVVDIHNVASTTYAGFTSLSNIVAWPSFGACSSCSGIDNSENFPAGQADSGHIQKLAAGQPHILHCIFSAAKFSQDAQIDFL